MDGAGDAEVLERGAGPRLGPRARRVLATALAVLLVLAGAAGLVDDRLRDRDRRAVAACRDAAVAAEARSAATVGFMVEHVEPALYVVRAPQRRDGLVALVADAAARSAPVVRAALAACERTEVAWWHRDLADRRTAHVDYLRARVAWLADVAADGHHYYRDQPRLAGLRERALGH